MPVSPAIVEDYAEYADGIRQVLDRSSGCACVAICPSAEDALARLPGLAPQVVLMDIHLPGRSAIELSRDPRIAPARRPVAAIRQANSPSPVTPLNAAESPQRLQQNRGLSGFDQ